MQKKLFIFGLRVLVHRHGDKFHLADGAKETIDFLRRRGDEVALAVLGKMNEQVEKIAFMEAHGIHFKSVVTSESETELVGYIKSAMNLHAADESFCIHRDPVILKMAKKAGAKVIRIGDTTAIRFRIISSLTDIVEHYKEL